MQTQLPMLVFVPTSPLWWLADDAEMILCDIMTPDGQLLGWCFIRKDKIGASK